ncbi:asparagine synthase-related protein [Aurantiacibacter sp. MUD11]|uniref:asparagine synthase-related protein n=1 Tax=Aurantiacibacter sp. MUD11 TaxID=3003265 RepID=UPI0022AA7FEF|nr:asparagine synthase-related protein [Aurantiacibacter sp. MUD11]WAT18763.1 asparagine synthase-related protein [Aurantiacibacter sp. MUD11]
MNLFFGHLGQLTTRPDAVERVTEGFGVVPSLLSEQAGAALYSATDGGATLGTAQEDGTSLVLLGMILGGAPDWKGPGNPIDDPDSAAAYLLQRYRKLGTGFLDGIPGTYVLALHDGEKGATLLATDPAGGHSLFLRETGEGLQFASNLALMPTAFSGIALDRGLEDFLLGYQFLPGGRTVYKGVTTLPGGTLLQWRQGQVERHKIAAWAGDAPDLSQATLEEAMDALHDGFLQALEDVAPTHERVAVMLGGFDSALVAAGLRRLGKTVETFTFEFADGSFNQPMTERLSAEIGSQHHWVAIGPEVIADGLRNYGRRFNLTAVQPHYPIESVEVCRVIRAAGLKHALTGDGCDGLFLGYPTIYRRTRVVEALAKIPSPIRGLAESVFGSRALERRLGHPLRVGRNLMTMLRREPLVRDHFAARALDNRSLEWARGGPFEQERDVEEILRELAQPVANLSRVRRAYHSKALAGSNRNKVEGCFDTTGVAIVSPFSHPRFAKLASSMSDEMSRPQGGPANMGKHALMQMAVTRELLPADIVYQPKRSPAEAPVDGWYRGELRPLMEDLLGQLPFEIDRQFADSLFSKKWSEDLFRNKVALDTIASHALTALATYGAFNGVLQETEA